MLKPKPCWRATTRVRNAEFGAARPDASPGRTEYRIAATRECFPILPSLLGTCDKALDKERHLIENFFARLEQYREIATRHDRTARNVLAGVTWPLRRLD